MRLIITGSSGFIGQNFVKSNTDFSITEVDLLNKKLKDVDFSNCDVILHLAAIVHQMKGAPEEEYFKINRDLAFDVAKKAKSEGVKQFVFLSTVKVYGESTTGKTAWNEYSECNPVDSYGKSKFEAEKLLLSLQAENFSVAVVRSPLVYGVGVKANMYSLVRLVNRYPILPLAGISNVRSMVFVGNLIALLSHIIKMKAQGVFIAGDKYPLSTTQLTKLIAKTSERKIFLVKIPRYAISLMKKASPKIVERLFGSLEVDNSFTNKRLEFDPPCTTAEGIKIMVEWYLKKGL